MSSDAETRQVTVEVPADRIEQFQAFVQWFLAGPQGRRGRGRGHRPHRAHGHGGGHHHGGCAGRRGEGRGRGETPAEPVVEV